MSSPDWVGPALARSRSRAERERQQAAAAEEGFVPLGPRVPGVALDLTALPPEEQLRLPGSAGRDAVWARSPFTEVGLHELAALALLPPGRGRREPWRLAELLSGDVDRLRDRLDGRHQVKIACSAQLHAVLLEPVAATGRAWPLWKRHPELADQETVAAEAVLGVLGGELCGCVQAACDWDDPERSLPRALEPLRLLTRARDWAARGVPGRAADPLLAARFPAAQAGAWPGMAHLDAARWWAAGVRSLDEAARWADQLGAGPAEAAAATALGAGLRELDPWAPAGLPAGAAALLRRAGVRGPSHLNR